MRITISFGLVLILTGCTGAQMQAMQMRSTFDSSTVEFKKCVTDVYYDPLYDDIRKHIPSPDYNFQPTPEQLANKKIPTSKEAKLFMQMRTDSMPCTQNFMMVMNQTAPSIAVIMQEQKNETDKIHAKLYDRKISWGKALEKISDIVTKHSAKLVAESQAIENRLAAQHQMQAAQINQAVNNYNTQLQQQQINNQMMYQQQQRNTLNCTTWQTGAFGNIRCH